VTRVQLPRMKHWFQMRRTVVLRPLLFLLMSVSLMASEPINRDAIVKQYCLPCHNLKVKSGSLTLEGLSAGNLPNTPTSGKRLSAN
jgi:hypothetical protein